MNLIAEYSPYLIVLTDGVEIILPDGENASFMHRYPEACLKGNKSALHEALLNTLIVSIKACDLLEVDFGETLMLAKNLQLVRENTYLPDKMETDDLEPSDINSYMTEEPSDIEEDIL